MNSFEQILESSWQALHKTHTIESVPAGKYRVVRLYGVMAFHVQQYRVENLGNLCTMTLNMGPMKMLTYVLTPYDKAMPMLSLDYISAGKNRKAIIEVYDLVKQPDTPEYQAILQQLQEVLNGYTDLQDTAGQPAWYDSLLNVKAYKSGTPEQEKRFESLFAALITTYGRAAASLPKLTEAQVTEQRDIIQDYSDHMVEDGGVSTKMFNKALGPDTTRDFFSTVFFAPQYVQAEI